LISPTAPALSSSGAPAPTSCASRNWAEPANTMLDIAIAASAGMPLCSATTP
jgi:hypothetical protein